MIKRSIFWFRRDLRLDDNAGLYHALKESTEVIPVFIFDIDILEKLENKSDRRVDFIHQAIKDLQIQLRAIGSDIEIYFSKPVDAFESIVKKYSLNAVYTNHDYEPYAIERDNEIKLFLEKHNVRFHSFKDQCIFEKNEIVKDDGTPYTVFTPFSKKWKQKLSSFYYKPYPTEKYFHHFKKHTLSDLPELSTMGFRKTDISFISPQFPSEALLNNYKSHRDFPFLNGTSRLSLHLRFGTVSIRKLVHYCIDKSEAWLNELIWREFYMVILWHFPHVVQGAFKKEYDMIPWLNAPENFEKWCEGKTGYPIVDAGMRELNATGYMHNRVRMIVSSFLVKDLLIDYKLGEAYFADKLNDFDLSANNGGWQWAAGCGCDAAPYFRIFNPTEQQKRFDPEFKYIKKWVPEFGTNEYPAPIIDHAFARNRTLSVYKKTLAEVRQLDLF